MVVDDQDADAHADKPRRTTVAAPGGDPHPRAGSRVFCRRRDPRYARPSRCGARRESGSQKITGLRCVWYYRHRLRKSPRNLLVIGLAPFARRHSSAYAFAKSAINLANPANSGGPPLYGVGSSLAIAVVGLVIGFVPMQLQRASSPASTPPARSASRRPTSKAFTCQSVRDLSPSRSAPPRDGSNSGAGDAMA